MSTVSRRSTRRLDHHLESGVRRMAGSVSEPLLASAAFDQLAHHAHQIVITGDSFRAKVRRRDGRKE